LEPGTEYNRIVTHDDLDGVVSAALISRATGIDSFYFTGPVSIQDGRTPTSESDIVCDLPCPVRVGMWFDHHQGNLADLELREIDPSDIPGRFAPERSCARVIFEYYKSSVEFPDFMEDTVVRTDRVDSFDYRTMEEWREPTVERRLADSIFAAFTDKRTFNTYLTGLIRLLRDMPMDEALNDPEVSDNVEAYRKMEEKSLVLIDQDTFFHETDVSKEVAVIDLTRHKRKPDVIRNAAFIRYPEALAVLLIQNQFRGGRKTNDLSFSMSLSFLMNTRDHNKDIGEIMRSLNAGDGHPGAGAGRIDCKSKDEMLKVKQATVSKIIGMWLVQ